LRSNTYYFAGNFSRSKKPTFWVMNELTTTPIFDLNRGRGMLKKNQVETTKKLDFQKLEYTWKAEK
jgi:hypothetical protein